jgi:hypothetical protein
MTASPPSIWRSAPFLLLWSTFFIGTAANVALLITISVAFYVNNGSALDAAAIFACRWVLPAFLAGVTNRILARSSPARAIAVAGLISALLALAIGPAYIFSNAAVFGVLLVRGVVEVGVKTANTVALKRLLNGKLLADAASVFNSSNYIGGALGALLAMPAVDLLGFEGMLVACACLFAAGGLAALLLPATPLGPFDAARPPLSPWTTVWQMRSQSGGVFDALIMLFVTVACFQGYHDAVRTTLPITYLETGKFGVGILQGITFGALIAAVLFYARYSAEGRFLSNVSDTALMVATCLFMGLAVLWREPWVAFTFYGAFIFCFELAYVQATKKILLHCSEEQIVAVSSAQWALICVAMVSGTLVNGWLIDAIGLKATAFVGVCAIAVWAAAAHYRIAKVPIS